MDQQKLYTFITDNRGKTKKRDIQQALLDSNLTSNEMAIVYKLYYEFK